MTEQIMTIAMLKNMDNGARTGGFELSIKTCKKCFQVGKDWLHTVVLCDKTGDMIADVFVGDRYSPLLKGAIRIIHAEVQDAELLNKPIKKLYVDQFEFAGYIGSEPEISTYGYELPDWEKISRGKVRHGVVCAYIQSGKEPDMAIVNEWVEFIMTG